MQIIFNRDKISMVSGASFGGRLSDDGILINFAIYMLFMYQKHTKIW